MIDVLENLYGFDEKIILAFYPHKLVDIICIRTESVLLLFDRNGLNAMRSVVAHS